jgi:hypothetical protein
MRFARRLLGVRFSVVAALPPNAPAEVMVTLVGNTFSSVTQDATTIYYGTLGNGANAPFSAICMIAKLERGRLRIPGTKAE